MIANRISQIKVLSDVSAEPVTLGEAKNYVHQSGNIDDALIESMVTAARIMCQNYAGVSIGDQSREFYFGHNAERPIHLPYNPKSLTKVEYRTCRLNPYAALTTEQYELEGSMFFGGFEAMYHVEATCGIFNDDIKQAILAQVLFMYINRGDMMANISNLCPESQSIMAKYRNAW